MNLRNSAAGDSGETGNVVMGVGNGQIQIRAICLHFLGTFAKRFSHILCKHRRPPEIQAGCWIVLFFCLEVWSCDPPASESLSMPLSSLHAHTKAETCEDTM